MRPHWIALLCFLSLAAGSILGATLLKRCEDPVPFPSDSSLADSLAAELGKANGDLLRQAEITEDLRWKLDSTIRANRKKSPKTRTNETYRAVYGTLPQHLADTLLAEPQPNP